MVDECDVRFFFWFFLLFFLWRNNDLKEKTIETAEDHLECGSNFS